MRAWVLTLLVLCGACGDDSAQPSWIPIGIRLPRVGTIGDLPGPERRIVVSVDKEGTLRLQGSAIEIGALRERFRLAVAAFHGDAPGDRPYDLVLAIDASVPWGAVMWTMIEVILADRRVADRVFFAVLPEHGDEEGGLAVSLPRDRGGLSPVVEVPPEVPSSVRVVANGADGLGPESVYAAVRASPQPVAWLAIGPEVDVETAYVLRVLDAAFRAGVRVAELTGGVQPPSSARGWARTFARGRVAAGRRTVRLDVSSVAAADPLPPVPRVRGGYAGSTGETLVPTYHPWSPGGPLGPRDRRKTDDVVDAALEWLASHQAAEGSWEAAKFDEWCRGKPAAPDPDRNDRGRPDFDVAVTGLALIAFLGAGYTNRGDHLYAKVVSKGLRWLKAVQDPEGCFGPRTTARFPFGHAVAALAMVEAYGMTESPIFKGPAQKALDFVAATPGEDGLWRPGGKTGEADAALTGWMTLCLADAVLINEDAEARGKVHPLQVDPRSLAAVRAWVDGNTDPATGRVGPSSVEAGSVPMWTAIGCLVRRLFGETSEKSEALRRGVDLLRAHPPAWEARVDPEYWYFGTLVLRYAGGEAWRDWDRAVAEEIGGHRRSEGDACGLRGSWDPFGPWAADGGRVHATAVLAMTENLLVLPYSLADLPRLGKSRDRAAAVDGKDESGDVGGGGEHHDR